MRKTQKNSREKIKINRLSADFVKQTMNCKVCQNLSGKNPNLSFFRFPSDYNRCREWADRCNILHMFEKFGPTKFYKSFRICSEHFDSKYIVFDGRKNKLLNGALPNAVISGSKMKEAEFVENRVDFTVTEKLLENLCRFCAEEKTDLTDIFSWSGKALELEEKIKVFPIAVNKCDKLPLKLCDSCIVKISKFYSFVRNCIRADQRLKTIIGIAENLNYCNSEKSDVLVKIQERTIPTFDGPLNYSQGENHAGGSPKALESSVLLFLHDDENDLTKDVYQSYDAGNGSSYNEIILQGKSDLGRKFSVTQDGNTVDKYFCNVCSKTFGDLDILESHWKAHSLQADEHGRFVCQTCKKLFPNKYRLNEHYRIHTGEQPFKCTTCSKKFHKMSLLKQHSAIHETIKRFVCPVCNLRSSRKGNLIQHLKSHYKFKKKEKRNLSSTINDCIKVDYSANIKMVVTPTNDNIQQSAEENIQNANDITNNDVKFSCGTCQMKFPNLENLEQHIKRSADSAKPGCELSCKTTYTDFNMGDYVRGSLIGYPKSKSITQTENKQHLKTYQCEECGVRFKRKDTLTNHMRIHTGERPFVCGCCGFAFKQKGDCLKHERNHQKKSER